MHSSLIRKASFPPIVDSRTQVLVLGSLPGDASLRAGRYYAHPRNGFWRIVGGIIMVDLSLLEYEDRLTTLLSHGIGLWDVVGIARRKGSLDGALREIESNDLAGMVETLPALRAIAFNGGAAARLGRRQISPGSGLALLDLPSTSPAHAAIDLAEKTRRWLALRPFLAQPRG